MQCDNIRTTISGIHDISYPCWRLLKHTKGLEPILGRTLEEFV